MYRDGRCNLSTFDEFGGMDWVVDRVYRNLKDDVSNLVVPALEKLGLGDTDMKYFDRDWKPFAFQPLKVATPELYVKFINEIKILKECGI